MIDQITYTIGEALGAPVVKRYGIAVGTPPMVHVGGADHVPVLNDKSGSMSWWKVGSVMSMATGSIVRYNVTLRYEMCVEVSCGVHGVLSGLASGLRNSAKDVRVALGLMSLDIGTVNEYAQVQYDGVPLHRVVIALEFTVSILYNAGCLPACGDTQSLLCNLIDKATNAQVVACLGDRVDEICEGGEACPVTITVNDEEYMEDVDPCEMPTVNIGLVDQDGNDIPFTIDGGNIVVNTSTEVPYIIPYDDAADAAADTTTVPTELQAVLLRDTKRQYPGNGVSTVSQIVGSGRFLLPVNEDGSNGLTTTMLSDTVQIQTNTI